jgi:uncharacterized membrane protein
MAGVLLLSATFMACVVEMVEALTIILAAGVTRGWCSALFGAAAGAGALLILIVIFGQTLTERVDIDALRLLIGTLLLIFGLQWLRKAILRASAWKSLHDEERIFVDEVKELTMVRPSGAGLIDWLGFTVSFKGVFLEGLEVVFIVLTFGASIRAVTVGSQVLNGVQAASLGALAALVLVAIIGALIHRPLARVPENQLKFVVGIMLASFGTFWAGEGVGIAWPGADLAILALLVTYAVAALAAVAVMKRSLAVEAAR